MQALHRRCGWFHILGSCATRRLELKNPVVKTPEPKIWKIFEKNKNLGAKRPKFWTLSGREAPEKIGVLSVLKGKTVKRCGREAPENLGYIKTL